MLKDARQDARDFDVSDFSRRASGFADDARFRACSARLSRRAELYLCGAPRSPRSTFPRSQCGGRFVGSARPSQFVSAPARSPRSVAPRARACVPGAPGRIHGARRGHISTAIHLRRRLHLRTLRRPCARHGLVYKHGDAWRLTRTSVDRRDWAVSPAAAIRKSGGRCSARARSAHSRNVFAARRGGGVAMTGLLVARPRHGRNAGTGDSKPAGHFVPHGAGWPSARCSRVTARNEGACRARARG